MKTSQGMIAGMLVATLALSACTSYNSVNLKKENLNNNYSYYKMDPPLYIGDHVKYKLKDGNSGEMTVSKIEPNSIVGDAGRVIPLSELSTLERKDISKGKTTAAVGGGVAVTTVVIGVMLVVGLAAGIGAGLGAL